MSEVDKKNDLQTSTDKADIFFSPTVSLKVQDGVTCNKVYQASKLMFCQVPTRTKNCSRVVGKTKRSLSITV